MLDTTYRYYVVNLGLNFNVIALAGIPLFALLCFFKLKFADSLVLGGGLLWLALMIIRPHKEVALVIESIVYCLCDLA